ncbi:hypothetical protein Tco_0624683 [Tanacetum coccineum]|uniref:Uncharacterized protein n=1 Tax=Tanacetum coccineum TaxID=301880 RepID=A0ABQ4WEM4_9ASTR
MKKFPSIPLRLEEDYHSIKDDILLVSVYTTGNVTVRGMLITNKLFTDDIYATEEYKEYIKMFVGVDVPAIHPQPVGSTQGTNKTPSAHRTPISTTITGDVISVKQFQSSITPIPTPTYDDDDSGNRIEPGSHKEHPKIVDDGDENEKEKKDDNNDDDDVNDDHTYHTLDETYEMGSLGTRNEKIQTPIPLYLRSPRTDLSSKKNLSQELTVTVSPTTTTTSHDPSKSKRISNKYTHILGALYGICRRQDIMIKQMEKKLVTNRDFYAIHKNVDNSLQDQDDDPKLWEVLKCKFEKYSTLFGPCRTNTFCDSNHDDHQEDDAPPEGEKRVKRRRTSKRSKSARGLSSKQPAQRSETYVSKRKQKQQEWDTWVEELVSDVDEVIPEDESHKIVKEFQDVDEHVSTIYDHERMEATLKDMMSSQFRDAEENPNEPPRYLCNKDLFYLKNGNTEERQYVLSLHKIHVVPFPEDLEEKMKRWVKKEFKTFNEEAQLLIQHWKYSWHKRLYKINRGRVIANPEEYFFNHKIVEVVRVTTEQWYILDFLEQIIMMRENDKPDSFSKADFKYLNKNDIEDLYYLCRNKKVNYRENKLLNSLMTFIRSRVIWERVHDFQLGIESYQIIVNLTAPTLTFPGIEACDAYSIVDKPSTSLIYLNNKNKKMVMYLVKIVKFCDATLERVLNEVKLKIFKAEFLKKAPLVGELDFDIMKAYEIKITKRLRHQEQMRRWESFVNGRPILPTMWRQ